MNDSGWTVARRAAVVATAAAALGLASCGGGGGAGGTGTVADSGTEKTTLRVDASDVDGDALQYQWRVTAGTVDNRNARETVWTLPEGPGLHFAYVLISDGKGGYVQQQYAVSTDTLRTTAPTRAPVSHTAPPVSDFAGTPMRLRFSAGAKPFTPPGGGTAGERTVYLPDVQVQVISGSETVFSGSTDLSGEVSLPKLAAGQNYQVLCTTTAGAVPTPCLASLPVGTVAAVSSISPALDSGRNLRLHGHIGLADGGVCGAHEAFFGVQSAATVRLLQADGVPMGTAVRVNRFGDYALDAAVPAQARFKLQVQCESYAVTLDVPAAAGAGYGSGTPVELSHQIPNTRPRIVKMVANGPEGSVRGEMVQLVPADAESNGLPSPDHFLSYKGLDTRMSGCMYYRALGAVGGCDAQGNMLAPISFEDWKRQNKFAPYAAGNTEVAANYVNKMDLNLVRRMVATRTADNAIAFYVCNSPGPDGASQAEVDHVIAVGLKDEKRVACVAMEWTPSAGANGGLPFTKFYTFGPDGSLLPSINLDGRGEKFLPGACVACHGGTQYNGRFPDKGNPSPYLGAAFLPFDTGNYYFGSSPALTEAQQTEGLYALNQLVRATELPTTAAPATPTTRLIDGWYAQGHTLDKSFLPPNWRIDESQPGNAGAARVYHEIVGASCRTCHTALGPTFDWDTVGALSLRGRAENHVCGGTADLAINASMPNALVSRDRVAEKLRADPALAALMRTFLGCDTPRPDPVYPKR